MMPDNSYLLKRMNKVPRGSEIASSLVLPVVHCNTDQPRRPQRLLKVCAVREPFLPEQVLAEPAAELLLADE